MTEIIQKKKHCNCLNFINLFQKLNPGKLPFQITKNQTQPPNIKLVRCTTYVHTLLSWSQSNLSFYRGLPSRNEVDSVRADVYMELHTNFLKFHPTPSQTRFHFVSTQVPRRLNPLRFQLSKKEEDGVGWKVFLQFCSGWKFSLKVEKKARAFIVPQVCSLCFIAGNLLALKTPVCIHQGLNLLRFGELSDTV